MGVNLSLRFRPIPSHYSYFFFVESYPPYHPHRLSPLPKNKQERKNTFCRSTQCQHIPFSTLSHQSLFFIRRVRSLLLSRKSHPKKKKKDLVKQSISTYPYSIFSISFTFPIQTHPLSPHHPSPPHRLSPQPKNHSKRIKNKSIL